MENYFIFAFILLSWTGIFLFEKLPVFMLYAIISLPYLFLKYGQFVRKKKFVPYGLLIGYFLFSGFVYYDTTKIVSLLFSLFLVAFFSIFFISLSRVSVKKIIIALKGVLVLYFLNVVISQILSYISYDENNYFFHYLFNIQSNTIRYFGFSTEPSYAAIIIVTTYYLLMNMIDKKITAIDKIKWSLLVGYMIFFFGSIYGYLYLLIVVFSILYKSYAKLLLSIIPIVLAVVFLIYLPGEETRIGKMLSFLMSGNILDIQQLNLVDSSTYMRVAPSLMMVDNLFSFDTFFFIGHGAGSSTVFFGNMFFEHIGKDAAGYETASLSLGFFPAFIYDYGIIGFLFVLFMFIDIIKKNYIYYFFIFLVLFNANFNTLLFWYVLLIAYANTEFGNLNNQYRMNKND